MLEIACLQNSPLELEDKAFPANNIRKVFASLGSAVVILIDEINKMLSAYKTYPSTHAILMRDLLAEEPQHQYLFEVLFNRGCKI